ncbi:MAG: S8 family serine peptidase [Raoultibacter sp.]
MGKFRLVVAGAFIACLSLVFSTVAFAQPAYAEGRALVCTQQGIARGIDPAAVDETFTWESLMDVSPASLSAVFADGGMQSRSAVAQSSSARISLVTSETLTSEELVAVLEARDDIVFAEVDRVFTAEELWGDEYDIAASSITSVVPKASDIVDPVLSYRNFQWFLGKGDPWASGLSTDYHVNNTGTTPGKGAVVAVLDTGVDGTHFSLRDRMVNLSTYPGLMDATQCGEHGFNAASDAGDDRSDSGDPASHGTHVAGIVAASSATGLGTDGVASEASLVAVRTVADDGSVALSSVVRGFNWLAEANKTYDVGIRAVNVSMKFPMMTRAESVALHELERVGIVPVFASGNENINVDNGESMASYGVPDSLVKVDSLEPTGLKAPYSCFGERSTHVFAPGSAVLSSVPDQAACFNAFTAAANVQANMTGGTQALVYEGFEKPSASHDASLAGGFTFNYASIGADGKPLEGEAVPTTTKAWFLGEQSLAVGMPVGESTTTLISAEKDLSAQILDSKQLYAGISASARESVYNVFFQYRLKDGTYSEKANDSKPLMRADASQWRTSGTALTQKVPANVDYEHFQVLITIEMDPGGTDPESDNTIYLDSFGVGCGLEKYSVFGGTSMAAPSVTGALGVLAAQYPDESPLQLSARIKGGTTPKSDLAGLCLSGGYLTIDKAANDPDPVPQALSVSGDTAVLSGWFFDQGASIVIGGIPLDPGAVQWGSGVAGVTARFQVPSDLADGVNEVSVTQDGQTGRAFLNVGSVGRSSGYRDLAVPSDSAITLPLLAAHDNTVYLFATLSLEENVIGFYRYDSEQDAWSDVQPYRLPEEINSLGSDGVQFGAPVSFGGKLYTLMTGSGSGQVHSWVLAFDPVTSEWSLSPDYGTDLYGASMVSWRGKLCLIGNAFNDDFTIDDTVTSYDPQTGAQDVIGHLPDALTGPAAMVSGDDLIVIGGFKEMGLPNNSVYVTDLVETNSFPFIEGADSVLLPPSIFAPVAEGGLLVGLRHQDGLKTSDTAVFDKQTGSWTWLDRLCSPTPMFGQSTVQVGSKVFVFGSSDSAPDFYFFRVTDVNDPAPTPDPTPTPTPLPIPSSQPTGGPGNLAATGDPLTAGTAALGLLALCGVAGVLALLATSALRSRRK